MALFKVTNLFDSGSGSLRQAISDANSTAGADEIQFSSISGTITLTSGELNITDSLTINGLGANLLSVSGNNASPVFFVYDGDDSTFIDVSLNGLTITDGFQASDGFSIFGGGILNGESLTITNSTISGNQADLVGGGIANAGNLSLSDSTISGNQAFYDGGIANIGTLTITNSTIADNLAFYHGGIASAGTLTITNSTISGNQAIVTDGGIYSNGNISIVNTIIADNIGGDCSIDNGTVSLNINNLVEDGSCNPFLSGDPNLGPLRDNGGPTFTQALLPGSIAIDAGSNADIPPGITTDQRGLGFPRIIDGVVDIGAYEASQDVPSVPEPSSLFGIVTLVLVAIGSWRRQRK